MKKAQLAMETMNGAAVNPPYEEFEPLCNWRHDDRRETLVVHLPAFKREQLKVQISNLRNLKISGERPLEATKSSRFIKTIKIPRDCNAKEIRANFADGLLYIVMPRKDSSAPKQEHPPQLQNYKVNENSTPESIHDQATKLPTLAKADNATEKIASLNDAKLPKNVAHDSRLKSLKMMATNVVVVAVAAACLGAYIMYSFRSLYVED
ncbi:Inactive protein RESTRICTED TEV MOVEMENT 2 [Camellia lanceoleosa]|uniref:Inactive protein RESTRICTED TEV MOVEMENT 2 n=1 Tax=Camellia lanceoleosa TaxID=1840588 RepID=A0ACC0FP30_9ERIC|nr:Inactive protein RESTRICTED TEV MOVEMENT 2 [Camellia lanceoleosa]